MKINKYAFIILGALMVNTAFADEIEEVIVSSSLIDSAASEIGNPLHVVSGKDISNEATQSLGETLDDLLGVTSADYGSGIGQPIIRGMSGSRVKILDNSLVNRDVSGLGADHINDIDLSNVQQIEVIRGPSSLLYTNGTIGGIINVVDNSIAQNDIERKVKIGLESQSVNDGDTQSIFVQDRFNNINLTFAYKDSSFGNFDVPNGAVIHMEEEHHDEDEDHDEHEENLGYLDNSDFKSESMKFGASTNGDWGYLGFSVANIESLYGIPFHGEEHEEEHGEEEEEEGHDEHEGERIFSTTDSDKFDLRGSFNFADSSVNKIDFFIRDSDYILTEQHAEEEEHEEEGHDEHEGHAEGPTSFTNEALEAGLIFDLSNERLSQKFALNFVKEDTSVLGAEAFMNPASRDELTFGYFASQEVNDFHLDFGIRLDLIDNKGSISEAHEEEEHHDEDEDHDEDHDEHEEEMETSFYDKSFDNSSIAFSIGKSLNDFIDLDVGFASVERAPSSIELFMNGAHLATGRFEVGNASLNSEKSNNVDITLSFNNGGFFASATLFKNEVDNYIYLQDETEEEHEEHEEGHEEHAGLILSNYLQQDAELDGYEIEFGNSMDIGSGELTLSFGRDETSGKFSSGGNIPRLNPARNILKLKYAQDDMSLGINFKDVEKQNDIGTNETVTNAYQMLNVKLTKTFDFGNQGKLALSLFGNNMLDEAARNHASFVKNEVPLPGRNYGLRFNLEF